MDQAKLIDEALQRLDLPSDYALAKAWGLSTNTVSQYRTGKRQFDAYMINRVAESLDKDPRELIARRELAKSPTGERRVYWETLLRKRYGVASVGGCILALTALSTLVAPSTTDAIQFATSCYYVNSRRRALQALRRRALEALRSTLASWSAHTPPLALTAP